MDQLKFFTEYSLWYCIPALLIAGLYAYLLYSIPYHWSIRTNQILAAIRFVLVFLLFFLLLGPLVKYFFNTEDKPATIVLIDHSSSIASAVKPEILKKSIEQFNQKISEQNTEVYWHDLNQNINKDTAELKFNHPTSNISKALRTIHSNFENRSIAGVILWSDGIYNQGTSPAYLKFPFPVYSIGLGDSIPKKDIRVRNVLQNSIAFVNNEFPLVAEIESKGYENTTVRVSVKENGNTITSKEIVLKSDIYATAVDFYISSDKKGIHHYTIEITPRPGEFNIKNNIYHCYIELLENKQKILIAASSPHPDINAIRSALESKLNYEVSLYIPQIYPLKKDNYDLIIAHQIPDATGQFNSFLQEAAAQKTPIWFIVGNQTYLTEFNRQNNTVDIRSRGTQKDLAGAEYHPTFSRYKLSDKEKNTIGKYPPITVPFGDIVSKSETEIVLQQKIGSTASGKPLFIMKQDRSQAVFCGEGMWHWRIQEFETEESFEVFDGFINNVTQLLAAKDDKRKFKVIPKEKEIFFGTSMYFQTEFYNDVLEKIYDQSIQLTLIHESKKSYKYNYTNTENNPYFEVKGLPAGVYNYIAKSGKEEYRGQFTIKDVQMESLQTVADFESLRQLSKNNNATFTRWSSKDEDLWMNKIIKSMKFIAQIQTREEFKNLVSFPWLLVLLLSLATLEWSIRKYKGLY